MRWLAGVSLLLAILGFFQYRLWFKAGGVMELLHLHRALSKETMVLQQLRTENDALIGQIKHLKTSPDEAELHARDEFGMIKKDEKFYRIIES